jgi:uncharacterized protein YutE (UPF0331/DUF86 family)
MVRTEPREVDIKRWRTEILALLEDFPRQLEALETAMGEFGEDFDLQSFKSAYETHRDMRAYNKVQAVERGLGRVQNYVADLAITASKLAELDVEVKDAGKAEQAFDSLREADVISGQLHRSLRRAQKARTLIEHSYVKVSAGKVHEAAALIRDTAAQFIAAYRTWIPDYL